MGDIQAATTGNLANAQNVMITQCVYTAEHSDPVSSLVTNFSLPKGHKTLTYPKVGQMTASNLTDGEDIIDQENIGLTSVDLTTSEVGLKVILTDKLVRQFNEDTFKVIGRQMGDAMSRKLDRDLIALFSALNGGTTWGVDNLVLSIAHAAGISGRARANKWPRPIYAVHHPNAMGALAKATMAVGATYYAGILDTISKEIFANFWRYSIDGIKWFEDGNIDKVAGQDSGYGAAFSKDALACIKSLAPTTERERDASLRATEVVIVSDYGVFELDDGYGAPLLYEIGNMDTT
uniref:Putative capsid protein n=1 Tax=viral metagenome TaxID=1070528 RepID=A0A6H1ZDM2_9ZZZZ